MDSRTELELLSIKLRGIIIQKASELENVIDMYIAMYFTSAFDNLKISEYIFLVGSKMTFDSKRLIFNYLVNNYDKSFTEKHPKFNNDLLELNEHRNRFAHYPLDDSDDSMNEFEQHQRVYFIKLKNKITKVGYNVAKVNGIAESMHDYAEAIKRLMRIKKSPRSPV